MKLPWIIISCIHLAIAGFAGEPLELRVEGRRLYVKAHIPPGVTQFEVRIASDRNQTISRFSDISPNDLQYEKRQAQYAKYNRDFFYPVVDVALEPGMEGVGVFNDDARGTYIAGGPYYRERLVLASEIVIPPHKLEPWENALFVEPRTGNTLQRFYLTNTYPVILREFSHTYELLSEDWSGTVSIHIPDKNGVQELARQQIASPASPASKALKAFQGTGISRERLTTSLEALLRDLLRRQNNDPVSPMYGALHNFYDLDAKTHRTAYWIWGGAPFVKLAIDALTLPEIQEKFTRDTLMHSAEKVGNLYLKYQVREKNHPSRGSFLVIWVRGLREENGFKKWVGTSDSGMMVRWAIMPLFEATGDSTYLEAAKLWVDEEERLLDAYEIIPHRFYYDDDEFSPSILDETGWDPEGHAALYEVTGEDRYRQIGKQYMDQHMAKFARDDGLWQRVYNIETEETVETARMTRGLGWAMEGLLAMNRMYPDTEYLAYAEKMAEHLIRSQHPSGAWSFVFDLPPDSLGITEKGTAFWSLMFYQLYKATDQEKYLITARRALTWCLDHQYTGPDPEAIGSLVGNTPASAVGYRFFFNVSCAYTSGFLGLAILEELKLMEQ